MSTFIVNFCTYCGAGARLSPTNSTLQCSKLCARSSNAAQEKQVAATQANKAHRVARDNNGVSDRLGNAWPPLPSLTPSIVPMAKPSSAVAAARAFAHQAALKATALKADALNAARKAAALQRASALQNAAALEAAALQTAAALEAAAASKPSTIAPAASDFEKVVARLSAGGYTAREKGAGNQPAPFTYTPTSQSASHSLSSACVLAPLVPHAKRGTPHAVPLVAQEATVSSALSPASSTSWGTTLRGTKRLALLQ
jgi:hypothetical protein